MGQEDPQEIADALYARLRAEAIKRLADLPDTLSERSELGTPWLEYAMQIQGQKGPLFAAYQDTVNAICSALAGGLSSQELESLWPDSEGFLYWTHDGTPTLEHQRADVAEEIAFRVREEAMNLELPSP